MATILRQHGLWLGALICAVGGGALLAGDVPRGRPIEFSEPRSEQTNNVQSLMPGHNSMLDQLEADFNRPFKSILQGNSFNGLIMPEPGVAQPTVPSARVREMIKHQDDRKYQTPDEWYAPKTVEDRYKPHELTPDGRDIDSLPAAERQMIRALNGDRSKLATNQMNGIIGPGYGNPRGGLFSNPNAINGATYGTMNPQESGLRKILGMDNDSSAAARAREQRDARDLFGLGDNYKAPAKLTPAELQKRDAWMQLYNNNYVAPVEGAAPTAGGFSTPYVDSSFYDPPKPVVPAAAAASTAFSGSDSAMSTAKAYTPSYTPPRAPEPPPAARVEPTSPFMTVPKRVF